MRVKSLLADVVVKVKKLLFSKKVTIDRPVKEFYISDDEKARFFLERPEVKEEIKKARDVSFKNGFEEGAKKKGEEVGAAIEALRETIRELKVAEKKLVEQLEPQVVDLAIKAAEFVIGKEIDAASVDLEKIIKPVLSKIPDATRIIIRVNPQDLSQLREFSNDLVEEGNIENLEVVSDSSVSSGGCMIDTDVGIIDATRETRVEQMKETLSGKGQES